jgi:hypothetical protein
MDPTNPNQSPEQTLEFDRLFTSFDFQSVFELYEYQDSIMELEDGEVKLISHPVSLQFAEKFKDSAGLLEENSDYYDGITTPEGTELEDLIAEDLIIQKLLKDRNVAHDDLDRAQFAKAIRIRRSVLVYLYREDERSPLAPEADAPTAVDIIHALKSRLGKAG